jgi:hypothetical protein
LIDSYGQFLCQWRERKPPHSCTDTGISLHSKYVAVANLQKQVSILRISLVHCIISLLMHQFNCSSSDFLKVMDSSLVNRCPHRSEIQSIVLSETESTWLCIDINRWHTVCTLASLPYWWSWWLLKLFAGPGHLVLGSVDGYGHLIVSRLDTSGNGIVLLILALIISA